MDSILNWLASINWNHVANIVFEHHEWLYLLPYPIIILSTWSILKNTFIKKWYINLFLTLLTTVGFGFYQLKNTSPTSVPIDFGLIEAVAKELVIGSSIGLIAIFIIMCKGIFNLFKKDKTSEMMA